MLFYIKLLYTNEIIFFNKHIWAYTADDVCHYFCLGYCVQNTVDIEVQGDPEINKSKT